MKLPIVNVLNKKHKNFHFDKHDPDSKYYVSALQPAEVMSLDIQAGSMIVKFISGMTAEVSASYFFDQYHIVKKT